MFRTVRLGNWHMGNSYNRRSLYYLIVGADTNTNEGLGRLLAAIALFIAIGGTIVWALAGFMPA